MTTRYRYRIYRKPRGDDENGWLAVAVRDDIVGANDAVRDGKYVDRLRPKTPGIYRIVKVRR